MSDLIKAIKYICNWYPFFIKGQQVVAQFGNTISPQVVDDFKIRVNLLCTVNTLSKNLKPLLPTMEGLKVELGVIDG